MEVVGDARVSENWSQRVELQGTNGFGGLSTGLIRIRSQMWEGESEDAEKMLQHKSPWDKGEIKMKIRKLWKELWQDYDKITK